MTANTLTQPGLSAQVQTPRENLSAYFARRISYNRNRAATTEFQGEHDHAIAEIARYQRLSQMIGGAA